jgi:hypothetical protein
LIKILVRFGPIACTASIHNNGAINDGKIGYHHSSSFIEFFKRYTGQTPSSLKTPPFKERPVFMDYLYGFISTALHSG